MEEDEEEQDALFQEEEVDDDEGLELDSDTPPHLRDLASAAEIGDLDALRQALGAIIYTLSSSVLVGLILMYRFLPFTSTDVILHLQPLRLVFT